MAPIHVVLAGLVAVIWGIAFVVSKIGLDSFTPPELTALRFIVAALAVVVFPRPAIAWSALLAVGLTVFTGQFLLQFFGIAYGMPVGLTAFVVHTQALFTVLFASLTMGDWPTPRQLTSMLIASLGLLLIASSLGADVPALAFALTLAAAISWGIGNVLVKRLPSVNPLHLMVWASLVPPLPALAVSVAMDGPMALITAVIEASWSGWFAVLYLGVLASVVAFAIWGELLQRYPTGAVAPFALLTPAVGAIASALFTGESFGAVRLAGMACMLVGLAVVVLPGGASRPALERPR